MSAADTLPPAYLYQADLQAELAALCQRYHVRKLAFFGSVLRSDFGPDSNTDVLVEFEPGQTPGLAFFALQDELTALPGRPVDLHTPNSLSPYFRRQVQDTAYVQYTER